MFREQNSKVRIKKYSAGKLCEYINGVRPHLEAKNAMLDDSLFARFAYSTLTVNSIGFTRDIISIDFDMGTKDYDEAIAKCKGVLDQAIEDEDYDKAENIKLKMEDIENNKHLYEKMSRETLRSDWYNDGFTIDYKRNGTEMPQSITYVRLFRSVGQAKKGSCIFVNKDKFVRLRNFLQMGLDIDLNKLSQAETVSLEAYMPLATSSIVDTIKIDPKEILILDDVDSKFITQTVNVYSDDTWKCYVERCDAYELKNTLFDGQALIDESIFPEWGVGYILLRQHFTKCAAFKTNIQLFFKDYFGDKYETATVTDMWGKKHRAKDIKLITTNNAIKWLKFGVTFKEWADQVKKCKCNFGIVKTAHSSKIDEGIQQASYQMMNCMDIDDVDEIMSVTNEYVVKLKTDTNAFVDYLQKNANVVNDFEMLCALIKHNPNIEFTDWFKKRRSDIIHKYVEYVHTGKVLQNADNLTIVCAPYGMLLHAVGKNPEQEGIFLPSKDFIECYTPRFEDGELLAAFRNPHNSLNNICCFKNKHDEKFDRYFDISQYCIAINGIHTDFQDRLNGCDMDSDSVYVTNEPHIVKRAKYAYANYPTIVNKIKPGSISANNIKDRTANELLFDIDNMLCQAQRAIGESSNLAQIALSYSYTFDNEKLDDYVCILSVLAQAAIDAAKRPSLVDIPAEIRRIKQEMDVAAHGYPSFWKRIHPETDATKINNGIICPMNKLAKYNITTVRQSKTLYNINDFIIDYAWEGGKAAKSVMELTEEFRKVKSYYKMEHALKDDDYDSMLIFLNDDFDQLINKLNRVYLSKNAKGLMSKLIREAFKDGKTPQEKRLISMRRTTLLSVLYHTSPATFLSCFKSKEEFEKELDK